MFKSYNKQLIGEYLTNMKKSDFLILTKFLNWEKD